MELIECRGLESLAALDSLPSGAEVIRLVGSVGGLGPLGVEQIAQEVNRSLKIGSLPGRRAVSIKGATRESRAGVNGPVLDPDWRSDEVQAEPQGVVEGDARPGPKPGQWECAYSARCGVVA
ncbi:MAG: hypothetical protein ACI8QC_003585 [Planctomycetota bacterium]|jgi:hypothetical protein